MVKAGNKILVVVQARSNSTRLKDKIFLPLWFSKLSIKYWFWYKIPFPIAKICWNFKIIGSQIKQFIKEMLRRVLIFS